MEEQGKQDEDGMDDVQERCRWSGTSMALGRMPHDVEQRARAHLAADLGPPRLVPLCLAVPLVSHINNTCSRGASQRVENVP